MSDENEKTELVESVTDKSVLSPENFKFASLIAGGKSAPEAYKEAFPERASSKWMSVNAYTLAKSPKIREQIDTLQQATRLQIVMELPEAFERVKTLSQSAASERVKLDANLQILDRGGLKAPVRVESMNIGIFGSLDPEDVKAMLRRNLERNKE